MRSQSPNERRRSGRASKASAASIRAEASGRAAPRALAHGEILRRDLVLAGLDHGAQQRQRVGERAQFGKADAAFGARDVIEVRAERIVELPALHVRRRLRRKRLLRAEPGVRRHAGDGVARRLGKAREHARGQRAFDGVRGHAGFLAAPLARFAGEGLGLRGAALAPALAIGLRKSARGHAGAGMLRLPLGIGVLGLGSKS